MFSYDKPVPLASASVAQVHVAGAQCLALSHLISRLQELSAACSATSHLRRRSCMTSICRAQLESCLTQHQAPEACCTQAVLRDSGKEVVIKVLKPGVEDVLTTDLNFLYVTSRVLELINPGLARTSITGIISDIRQVSAWCSSWVQSAQPWASHVPAFIILREPVRVPGCECTQVLQAGRRAVVPSPNICLVNASKCQPMCALCCPQRPCSGH